MWLAWLQLLSLNAPSTRHSLLQEAERAHTAELTSATAAAFVGGTEAALRSGPRQELEFVAHDVGMQYAGPDSEILGSASASVHISTDSVLTPVECLSIRLEAEKAMARGLSSDFTYTDLARVGEVHVADLPASCDLLRRKLESTLLPAIAECFTLDASSLRVRDAVVVQYDAAREATRQPVHRDEALVSFSIPLSARAEYGGGGTIFEGSGAVFTPPMGRLLCHASGMRHAGNAISRGVRWMLVVFLIAFQENSVDGTCAVFWAN